MSKKQLNPATTIRRTMPVDIEKLSGERGYLYYLYTDMIDMINKLEDVCTYMEFSQPWSDTAGAKQV